MTAKKSTLTFIELNVQGCVINHMPDTLNADDKAEYLTCKITEQNGCKLTFHLYVPEGIDVQSFINNKRTSKWTVRYEPRQAHLGHTYLYLTEILVSGTWLEITSA